MILLRLRLRIGRHLSLSPTHLLPLSPLVVRILTVSTVPLLSSEWGAREDLGDLVALLAAWGVWVIAVPPPALPLSLVSRTTPPTTMTFGHTTSLAQSRKRFLLSYSTVMGLLHLLVFLFLLRLWDIIMALHLWRLRLRLLLCRGVLCPMTISLSLRFGTMSFPHHGGVPTAVPSAQPPAPPHVPAPPPGMASGGVRSPPPVSSPPLVVTPPAVPLWPSETFKLPVLKDIKAYLDVYDMILYWLRQPEYGTLLSDESMLVTTPSNVAASLFWEGQIRSAVREGSLCFLFDNKGTLYHGKGLKCSLS